MPTYSLHRDKEVWGEDAEVFRPERWIEAMEEGEGASGGVPNKFQKAFNPFSFGPRACVGRNLASMELLMIIGALLRRYEFVLENPEQPVSVSLLFVCRALLRFALRSCGRARASCASLSIAGWACEGALWSEYNHCFELCYSSISGNNELLLSSLVCSVV